MRTILRVSCDAVKKSDSEGRVAIVILAGGDGSRMGGGKPLRLLSGATLLDRALDYARGWSDCVAIAARSIEQIGHPEAPVLIDSSGLAGPLAGLASAARLDRELVLTIPCDMPFLPDDLLSRLAEALLPACGAALGESDGHVQPVCGLWRAEALANLATYCESGRRSLIGFAETIGYTNVSWPSGAFFNVNTPQDLEAAQLQVG